MEPWLPELQAGQFVIDTTTGDLARGRAWSGACGQFGASYLEAPISGSSVQTQQGEATVIVSGNPEAYRQCADLWPILGRKTFYVGPSGTAPMMKLVSNLVLGLNRAALAEGLRFAEVLGLDLHATLEVLQGSAAYSRQMDTKGAKMIHREYSVQARLAQHLKDVRLMLDAAGEQGQSLPLTATHRGLLETAEQLGWGEVDNSAIIEAWRTATA